MSRLTWTAGMAALALSPLILSGAAPAATAHNSQAGAWGPRSNQCDPTPYFPAGDCLSSYITDSASDALPPPRPYRRSHRAPSSDD